VISRALQAQIQRALRDFSVVGLIGSRQSGKTTLAKTVVKAMRQKALYLDLELPSDLAKLDSPELFLREHIDELVVIDEVQRKPELFPLLRALVDVGRRRKGRYLILGSASPALLRQASESLAGRIVYHELTPFAVGEVGFKRANRHWLRGGYPLSFLARSESASRAWREAFMRTYLERDLPQLGVRIPAAQMRRFWQMLAHSHGQLWNASKIAGSMAVSAPAVRRYLDILAETFLVRQLLPEHANLKKRLVKAPKVYLRDTGLLHSLMGISSRDQLLSSPIAGASWEGWVIEQICTALPDTWQSTFFRTGAGAEIDLVLRPPRGRPIAVEAKLSMQPTLTRGFRQGFADLKCKAGYVVCPVTSSFPIAPKVRACGLEEVLAELPIMRG